MNDLEVELMCPICYDIFIEPAVVGCGHMFCHFCITQWFTRSNSCPTCRMDTATVVRIRNGNTIMNLATELTSEEARDRREAAVRQRNIDLKNFEDARRQRRQPIQVSPPLLNWNQLEHSSNQFQGRTYYHHRHNSSRLANNRGRAPYHFFGRNPPNFNRQRHNGWRRLF